MCRMLPVARFSAATPEKPDVQVDTKAVSPSADMPSGITSPLSDAGTVRASAAVRLAVGCTGHSVDQAGHAAAA